MKKTDIAAYVFGGSVGIAIGCFIYGLILYGLLALGVTAIAVYVHSQGEVVQGEMEHFTSEEGEAVEELLEQMRGGDFGDDPRLTAAESAAVDQLLARMRRKKT